MNTTKKNGLIFTIFILIFCLMIFSSCNFTKIKVIFDSNGGSKVDAVETDGASSIKLPPKPTRDGYIFMGWYYDKEAFRNRFEARSLIDMPITSNLTVYAKWVKILLGTEGLEYSITDNGYTITGYTGTSESVVVPAIQNDIIVTKIEESAFEDNIAIKSIIVPNTVEEIGEGAFKGCVNLEEMSLPFVGGNRNANATKDCVLGYIFGYTEKFALGGLPLTQQYYASQDYLFYYIPLTLRKVELTDAYYIPYGAFYGCSYITQIILPQSVYGIGSSAFNNCKDLRSILLPKGTINIGMNAFKSCQSLTIYSERNMPPSGWSNSWNPDDAMVYWNVNKDVFGEYDGFQYFAEFDKISITRYSAPNGDITIPTTIEGKTVATIKDMAFSGNSVIKSVTIPQGISNIGFGIFMDCKKLESISIPFIGDKPINGENTHLGYLFGAYNGSVNKEFVPKNLKSVDISGGTEIYDSAFFNCDTLENITLANSITKIGNSAFRDCIKLKGMVLPNGVKTIGEYAFSSCSDAISINVPNSVTSIGKYAFQNCSSLLETTIPYGITSIEEYTYYKCSALTQIILPSTITSIKKYAFAECTNITGLVIPQGVVTIGDKVFSELNKLISMVIPNTVTEMGDWVFENCSRMIYVYIPNSVNGLGIQAFKGCTTLSIHAQAISKPAGWGLQWNIEDRPVLWNQPPPQS